MIDKTMLIGLDGATFSILNPLMEQGIMPFLKQLMASGVSGKLLSTVPPNTPAAWTSITTGRGPGNHGIIDYVRFESPDSKYLRFNGSNNVASETIWSIVSRHGLRTTSLNFPLMTPPLPINGFIVPGWIVWRYMKYGCYPAEFYDRLKDLPFFNVKELAMDIEIEEVSLDDYPEEEWEDRIKVYIRREKQWFELLCYMIEKEPCDFTGIIFDGVHRLQHLCWRLIHPDYLPKDLSPIENKAHELCLEYFSQLDSFIAEIVKLAGPETKLFFASAYGYTASVETFYINTWLHQNGYLEWIEGAEEDASSSTSPARYFNTIDLTKTTAFAITSSSNSIYFSVAGRRGEHGISPENYNSFRQELIDKLLAFTDPADGKPVVTKVWTREEAYSGSQIDTAPDLTLELRDHGFISTIRSKTLVEHRTQPIGIHHPEGIFMAMGPGISKNTVMEPFSILDVAPMLLHSLNIPLPEDLEGHIPEGVFTPDFIKEHPIKISSPTITPDAIPAPLKLQQDEEAQQKVLQRLKKLGYIE